MQDMQKFFFVCLIDNLKILFIFYLVFVLLFCVALIAFTCNMGLVRITCTYPDCTHNIPPTIQYPDRIPSFRVWAVMHVQRWTMCPSTTDLC